MKQVNFNFSKEKFFILLTLFFQLTDSGEHGGPAVSALRAVEEELNISPGAVILLLQQMVEKSVKGDILATGLATANHVIKKILKIMIFNN